MYFIPQSKQIKGDKMQNENQETGSRKSRSFYISLGLLFGHLGAHNFYAAQYPAAIVKIAITIGAIIAAANTAPHEKLWLTIFGINSYFVIWDLCFDPNIPTREREKICGLPPWAASLIFLLLMLAANAAIRSGAFK